MSLGHVRDFPKELGTPVPACLDAVFVMSVQRHLSVCLAEAYYVETVGGRAYD
jgi:hypothetical protein